MKSRGVWKLLYTSITYIPYDPKTGISLARPRTLKSIYCGKRTRRYMILSLGAVALGSQSENILFKKEVFL